MQKRKMSSSSRVGFVYILCEVSQSISQLGFAVLLLLPSVSLVTKLGLVKQLRNTVSTLCDLLKWLDDPKVTIADPLPSTPFLTALFRLDQALFRGRLTLIYNNLGKTFENRLAK